MHLPSLPREFKTGSWLDAKATAVRTAGKPDERAQLIGLIWVSRVGLLGDNRVKFEVGSARRNKLALMHAPDGVGQVRSAASWSGYDVRVTNHWFLYSW